MGARVIEIEPNVLDYPDGARYWCQARCLLDGQPCPYTTTKFHLRWNSSLCDWHIDEHKLAKYQP